MVIIAVIVLAPVVLATVTLVYGLILQKGTSGAQTGIGVVVGSTGALLATIGLWVASRVASYAGAILLESTAGWVVGACLYVLAGVVFILRPTTIRQGVIWRWRESLRRASDSQVATDVTLLVIRVSGMILLLQGMAMLLLLLSA